MKIHENPPFVGIFKRIFRLILGEVKPMYVAGHGRTMIVVYRNRIQRLLYSNLCATFGESINVRRNTLKHECGVAIHETIIDNNVDIYGVNGYKGI